MEFQKFDGSKAQKNKCAPSKMEVGQVVVREGISSAYTYLLRTQMRKAMAQGMEFSVAEENGQFAIRRDA